MFFKGLLQKVLSTINLDVTWFIIVLFNNNNLLLHLLFDEGEHVCSLYM